MMICNPMAGFGQQQANPFDAWQKLWMQSLSSMQPQQPAKQDLPAPTDMFGQFQAMQNMWMSAMQPQQPKAVAPVNPFMAFMPTMPTMPAAQMPKITVTTIELGDMRPYMEMASSMMNAFAPMMNQWSRK